MMQAVSNETHRFAIDASSPLQAQDGLLRLTGWFAGRLEEPPRIRLSLASGNIFDCQTGKPRPDVAEVHPDFPGAAESGFELETYIPAGFHIGTLEYLGAGNSGWIPFHTLSFIAGLSPLIGKLESPLPDEEAKEWPVQGWCFHPQYEIEKLFLQFAHHETRVSHGISRPDVADHFPQFRSAAVSGFSGLLKLAPGTAPVMLTARLRNGSMVRQQVVPELRIANREVALARLAACKVRAARVKLAESPRPDASIIIPIYNQLELTLGCLESLSSHGGRLTFEVIVIDDCSAPEVGTVLSGIQNLRLITNQTNQGFVLNCNRGAAEARGEYLVFLNNDTEVSPGWLESLRDVFTTRPRAGLVGAKLVYPDGTLQEAGGIIWEDGTGHNFGKGDDPGRPEYNYLRQVDYCSGACLMVPRALFDRVGRFDTLYCPAYYEDTDLAFAIRKAGREVYYQPKAVIKHFEGSSSGTDTRVGPKRHQVINQGRFAKKWAETLVGYGADPTHADLARDRHATGRILVIDSCALTPDMDSGSLRMFNLLKILSREGCKVTFVAENLQFHEPFSALLQQEGVEHLGVPAIPDLKAHLELNAFAFDVIILSRKHVGQTLMQWVRRCAPRTKIVFDTVDLMFLRFDRQAAIENSEAVRAAAAASKKVELELCTAADLVYVVSPEEAAILSSDLPGEKIAVVSNIHEISAAGPAFNQREGILFVGGFQHPPNLDAIEFFLDEILPLLSERLPLLPVHIVGSNMPERLKKRAGPQIFVHGYVPDMTDLLNRVRVSIAPLRYGAGVKGKVNQSMAHGVPVIATSMATEGMHLHPGVNVMVGDTPRDFADALHRIYTDAELWRKVSAAGLENISAHFSFSAIRQKLFDSLRGLVPELLTPGRELPVREAATFGLNQVLHFDSSSTVDPFLDGGWSGPGETFRWAVARKARLRFRFETGRQPGKMKLLVFPLLVSGKVARQRITIGFPGSPMTHSVEMTRGEPHEFVVDLPPVGPTSDIFLVEFHFPDAVVPRELGLSEDLRRLSVAFMQLAFS